jgi:hypothetical protein
MIQLQPQDIADNFSLVQIDAEIVLIRAAINNAREMRDYQFDDMQARQKVARQTLSELNSELAIWLKARSILTGADSGYAEIIPVEYNPGLPRI